MLLVFIIGSPSYLLTLSSADTEIELSRAQPQNIGNAET